MAEGGRAALTAAGVLIAFLAPAAVLIAPGPVAAEGPDPSPPGALSPDAPRLRYPPSNTALAQLASVPLVWEDASPADRYQLQVTPTNSDGPALDTEVAGRAMYQFRAPALGDGPYHMLPGSRYAWRVRAWGGAGWGAWSEVRSFATPVVNAGGIAAVRPEMRSTAPDLNPVLVWTDSSPHVFLYEVQLSEDAGFPPTPGPGAPVFWNRVHGGMSDPVRSWRVPESVALEPERDYHWRVRPVVQDGPSPAWSATFTFTTPARPAPEPEEEPAPATYGVAVARPGAAASPAAPRGVAPPAPAAAAPVVTGSTGAVLSLINQTRAANGLAALAPNGALTRAAQLHSNDMAARNSMSHTGSNGSGPAQRISAAGYAWRQYGEIVAGGQTTAQAVVSAWLNSPSHRAVILTPGLREFGAAVAYSASGRPYWTVDFGTR